MKYKARVTHVRFNESKRPYNAYTVRADVDVVESDTDISNGRYPFYYQIDDVASPSISASLNMVTISVPEGTEVYYTTDGADPDNTKTKYTAPFALSATVTVKAIAYMGEVVSSVVSKRCEYITPPSAPSYSVAQNMVTVSCPTADSIYYTTNGEEPDSTKTKYTAPFAINSAVTVKAVGYKSGVKGTASSHQCTEYVTPPTAPSIQFTSPTVTITCASADAIYYTIDGSEPDSTKTAYSAPVTLEATATVKAVGYKSGVKGAVASQECTVSAEVI